MTGSILAFDRFTQAEEVMLLSVTTWALRAQCFRRLWRPYEQEIGMIHAESVKAVQELLVERGIQPKENERWGDYVARGLGLSETQAEGFLHALDKSLSIDEACAAAGI